MIREFVVDIFEPGGGTSGKGNKFPIVTHVFRGRTKKEAIHYFESHMKTDSFMRQCVNKGMFAGKVECRVKTRWRKKR